MREKKRWNQIWKICLSTSDLIRLTLVGVPPHGNGCIGCRVEIYSTKSNSIWSTGKRRGRRCLWLTLAEVDQHSICAAKGGLYEVVGRGWRCCGLATEVATQQRIEGFPLAVCNFCILVYIRIRLLHGRISEASWLFKSLCLPLAIERELLCIAR